MDSLNNLEEKVMLAVQKIGLLKDENGRLRTALEQAKVSLKNVEAEKAKIAAEIQKVQDLRDENETLKKDRQDFKDRVERIIEKVEVLSDIVIEDEILEDAVATVDGPEDSMEASEPINIPDTPLDDQEGEENEVVMPLYGGGDNQP